MISRYTPKTMGPFWTATAKYRMWLKVSLAILFAKAKAGLISMTDYRQIRRHAKVRLKRVIFWDEGPGGMRHDMQAFTEAVKESLREAGVPEPVIALFNKDVTSYDIEDSALALMLVKSGQSLIPRIKKVQQALLRRATEHKNTLMQGLSHGQAAEPITLALKLLNYVEMLDRDIARVTQAIEGVRVGRLAGAVGTYGHLGPEIEKVVCEDLGLKASRISTQIIHRDCHAALMDAITTLAQNVGHIAHNFWLMCQFQRGEAREPFRKGQRASTAMPHKKNPISLEQLRGMAQMMIGYQTVMKLAVVTYDERTIDQSCQERICWPDAFSIVAYMLEKLAVVVEGMLFFPDKMLANIAMTLGQTGSPYVKDALLGHGVTHFDIDGEKLQTYNWVQRCAGEAWERQVELIEVLRERGIGQYIKDDELTACFDPWRGLKYVPVIYERFGIESAKAAA